MLDTTTFPRLQRSTGAAFVALAAGAARPRVAGLRQAGSARAILPSVHGVAPEIVFLNTSGGLTSGDSLSYEVELGAGLRAVATTQTAERAYAAPDGPARARVRLRLDEGASLDWLPQETIVFDGAALARETEIDLADEARVLMIETVVLGRAARGETVRTLDLRDTRLIRRAGRRVHAESLRLDDTALAGGDRPALLGGARALSTLILVARGAEDAAAPLRRALAQAENVEAAVSGWNGRCVARISGRDGSPVRKALLRALEVLRGEPPPRVWQA